MRILPTLALAAALASACPAAAQTPDSARLAREPLFTRRDAVYAGAFAAGALALAPVDRELARSLQGDPQANDFLKSSASGFRLLGHPGTIGITGALYLAGRATDRASVADVGLHTAEAIVFAEVVTVAGKYLAGRARPSRDPDNATNFSLGRGVGDDDYQSFPSGHTSAAFAAAAAATGEIGRWWPEYRVPAGIALYTGATLVGVSRMYDNRHWASDVAVGAALGTFSGWKVVSYTHANPRNPIDRVLLRTAVVPTGRGEVLLVWTSAP